MDTYVGSGTFSHKLPVPRLVHTSCTQVLGEVAGSNATHSGVLRTPSLESVRPQCLFRTWASLISLLQGMGLRRLRCQP